MPAERILSSDVGQIVDGLRDHYVSRKAEIEWATCYWLTHTSTTEPYAWFRSKRDLKRFLAVFQSIVNDGRWRIEIPVHDLADEKKAIEKWRLRQGFYLVATQVQAAGEPMVARLHLRHPYDQGLIEKLSAAMNLSKTETRYWVVRKYSAHTLRFVLHMLAIMIFDEQALADGLTACRDIGSSGSSRKST